MVDSLISGDSSYLGRTGHCETQTADEGKNADCV